MSDPYALQRFVQAQDHGVYDEALREVRRGSKRGHWMWFVFPQIDGLGRSPTARHFALSGVREAEAYLAHPLLGPRLLACGQALTELGTTDAVGVFGSVDAQKLRSSMTLFHLAAPTELVFQQVLDGYFGGVPDQATVGILGR